MAKPQVLVLVLVALLLSASSLTEARKRQRRKSGSSRHGKEEPSFDPGCDLSAANIAKIVEWISSEDGGAFELNDVACTLRSGASKVGAAAGGIGAAYMGWQAGDSLAEKVIGAAGAGLAGWLVGGYVGDRTADLVIKSLGSTAFGAKSPDQMLRSCRQRLGVTADATARQIKRAYRQAALRHHPDKGGTQRDLIQDTVCKEALLAKCQARR